MYISQKNLDCALDMMTITVAKKTSLYVFSSKDFVLATQQLTNNLATDYTSKLRYTALISIIKEQVTGMRIMRIYSRDAVVPLSLCDPHAHSPKQILIRAPKNKEGSSSPITTSGDLTINIFPSTTRRKDNA
ncbi:hypothetical protein GWI33_007714 [Rhynchophorus ferrugineus]|uniref:Uncharacterized protein n=1 Tax=Rhynchophorus ferrugineus TaxID=354439 RepID=A0A834IHF8_RHYFE|nr:hypothetical protein GWI33_007714 [Rhynchophorus ferrugineus]